MGWTEGDARAALDRLIASEGADLVRKAARLRVALGRIGYQSGHEELSEQAIREMARRYSMVDTAPPVAVQVPPPINVARQWVDRSCTACGFVYATPPDDEDPRCPKCCGAYIRKYLQRAGSDPWMAKMLWLAEEMRQDNAAGFGEGLYPIPIANAPDEVVPQYGRWYHSPDIAVVPRYLVVDPETDQGVLTEFQLGMYCILLNLLNGQPMALSMFNPSKWANLQAMMKLALPEHIIRPGQCIRLDWKMNVPGPLRAVLWCRHVDARPTV